MQHARCCQPDTVRADVLLSVSDWHRKALHTSELRRNDGRFYDNPSRLRSDAEDRFGCQLRPRCSAWRLVPASAMHGLRCDARLRRGAGRARRSDDAVGELPLRGGARPDREAAAAAARDADVIVRVAEQLDGRLPLPAQSPAEEQETLRHHMVSGRNLTSKLTAPQLKQTRT